MAEGVGAIILGKDAMRPTEPGKTSPSTLKDNPIVFARALNQCQHS